jgi:dipeptidyl aminopeptidase/acylaminoacyl peptidase
MPKEHYSFERYLNVRSAGAPSFSHDGKRLGFLTNITGVSEVWSVPIDIHTTTPAWPDQLTFRGERVSGASYSPADDVLLVSADVGGNERDQLYLLSADGAIFTALTSQPETIHRFGGWSQDGSRIIYSSNQRDSRYFDIYERYIESGETKQLYQHDGTNHAFRYSLDGRYVLMNRWYSNVNNQLFMLDTITGETRTLTPESTDGHAIYAMPGWSANMDGLYLLSNSGRQFLSPAWLDLATAELTFLSDVQWDADSLSLTRDGTRLALVYNEDGYSRLLLFDVSQGWDARVEMSVPELPRGIFGVSWSKDGKRLAIGMYTATDAPDVWIWDVQEEILWRATRSSLGGIPQESFVEPSLVHYTTFDGRQIPAFLYLPHTTEPRSLPVVIHVHGGPEGQSRPEFDPVVQYLVAQGYAVLKPNVRGSTGYGYEYQSLDDVRLRMDSVADLQYAVFWLRESSIADPKRIAVMGGSYGGFMVLSAITTYPDLWTAAVDIVGIANFVTFLENTGPWRRKLREAEYGSLEQDREFLEQISPIHQVDRITSPLFVVHGANDPRVPVGEAEQIVAALRERNVPVEYMRFEDEGHGLVKRSNRLIAYPAIARFLDAYMGQGY